MATKTRDELKAVFSENSVPTAADFADLIDTATVVSGTLEVATVKATTALEAGTVTASSAMTANGGLSAKAGTTADGLKVDANGVTANVVLGAKKGLTVSYGTTPTEALKVDATNGLVTANAGFSAKAGTTADGLKVDANGVTANVALTANAGLSAKAGTTADGLKVDANGVTANVALAAKKGLTVSYGTTPTEALKVDATNGLVTANGGLSAKAGTTADGLKVDATGVTANVALAAKKGLTVSYGTTPTEALKVDATNGLVTANGGLSAKAGTTADGFKVDTTGVTANVALTANGGLSAKAGTTADGFKVDTTGVTANVAFTANGGLSAKAGTTADGFKVDTTGVTTNVAFTANGGLSAKAGTTADGLKVDANGVAANVALTANGGLSAKAGTTADGLKVDANGVTANVALGAKKGLTVSYGTTPTEALKVDTTSGLVTANAGFSAKAGTTADGLKVDANGVTANVALGAKKGLTVSYGTTPTEALKVDATSGLVKASKGLTVEGGDVTIGTTTTTQSLTVNGSLTVRGTLSVPALDWKQIPSHPAYYAKNQDGIVYLRGRLLDRPNELEDGSYHLATLPAEIRPETDSRIVASVRNGTGYPDKPTAIRITTAGRVLAEEFCTCASLDGISFRANGGPSLLLHLPLDGSVTDKSTYSRPISGLGPSWVSATQFGTSAKCADFGGYTSVYVNSLGCPDECTLSVWYMYEPTSVTTEQPIISCDNRPALVLRSGVPHLIDDDNGIIQIGSSATSYSWTHIVVVLGLDGITVYRNNSREVNNVSKRLRTDGFPLQIGHRPISNYGFWGKMAQLRVYNRVLTAAEITTLYATPTADLP